MARSRRRPASGKSSRIALDTLRANKLRSALTILGVVIGVTSIVAMTVADQRLRRSLESQIQQLGSNTVYVAEVQHPELRERQQLPRADQAART